MPAETLIPFDAEGPSAPPPTHGPTVLLQGSVRSETRSAAEVRLAYLFRLCPTHPLRPMVSDYRGVHE